MKNTILLNVMIAAVLACGARASAAELDLGGLRAENIPAGDYSLKAAAPRQAGDDLIGVDLTVRIPFKALKNGMRHMADAGTFLTIIDPAAAVAGGSGAFMKLSNIRVNCNGIIVVPVITLKPYLEGRDRLAIRVVKLQVHASMAPDPAAASHFTPLDNHAAPDTGPDMNQEELMALVMDALIQSTYAAMNADLKENNINMKAEQILSAKYDKTDWTLRATMSPKALEYFIHPGIIGKLHLTGFAMGPTGLVLAVRTEH